MDTSIQLVSIKQIQGTQLESPLAEQKVRAQGLVTGLVRRGFFIQTPNVEWDGQASDAVFVYSPRWDATRGSMVEVQGTVVDYRKHDSAKPVTQIHMDEAQDIKRSDAQGKNHRVEPVSFSQAFLPQDSTALAALLNSLNGMLISFSAGQTFIAPSNPFGDYVLALDGDTLDVANLRSEHRGVLIDGNNTLRWFPGFRITNYNHAPRLNVGAKLLTEINGPLNYRSGSYQISISDPIKIEPAYVNMTKSRFVSSANAVTIMTLNCFNLDPHIESASLVKNPRLDIDDDWGEGRFHTLSQAVVLQANTPDIIALQEIQDSDGAQLTEVVHASATYTALVKTIEQLSDVRYEWVDIDPMLGEDGGQPGGNIRNAYLYNPQRVTLVEGSTMILGKHEAAFEDSRKPLVAHFQERESGNIIACINVHLASKRHQNSIFAPTEPGQDAKLGVRIAQAKLVAQEIEKLASQSIDYYVTGDFNDTQYSETLRTFTGDHSVNLVDRLPATERYDYNHRGILQVLMHGIVSKKMAAGRADYEIIHGNELIGIKPGEESDKPSDHAYVIAKLHLQ